MNKPTRRSFLATVLALAGAATVVPKVTAEVKPISGYTLGTPGAASTTIEVSEPATAQYGRGEGTFAHLFQVKPDAEVTSLTLNQSYADNDALDSARHVTVGTMLTGPVPFDIPDGATPYSEFVTFRGRQGTKVARPQIFTPLSFEAMQQDCAARGCSLDPDSFGFVAHYTLGAPDSDGDRVASAVRLNRETDLARVDAWRRSLHKSGG